MRVNHGCPTYTNTCIHNTCTWINTCTVYTVYTVKPVLRDHCHERPPVLKNHILAEGCAFQCKSTCYQRPRDLSSETIFLWTMGGLSRQVLLYCVFCRSDETEENLYQTRTRKDQESRGLHIAICWGLML